MIILYEETATNFNTYGIGVLTEVSECKVTNQLNGSYELDIKILDTDQFADEIKLNRIILAPVQLDKSFDTTTQHQPFRISSITKDESDKIKIKANHISYDLSNVVVEPKTVNKGNRTGFEVSLEKIQNFKGGNKIWDWEISASTTNYSEYDNYEDDIVIGAPAAARTILGGDNGSFTKTYKAELEFDMFSVKIYPKFKMGKDNGIILSYGENIKDISKEENVESQATVIYPIYTKTDTSTSSSKNYFKYYETRVSDKIDEIEKFGNTYLQTKTLTTKRWVDLDNAQLPMHVYKVTSGEETVSSEKNYPILMWNGDVYIDISYVNDWYYGESYEDESYRGSVVNDKMDAIQDIFNMYKNAKYIDNNAIPSTSYSDIDLEAIYITYCDETGHTLSSVELESRTSNNIDVYVKFWEYYVSEGVPAFREHRKYQCFDTGSKRLQVKVLNRDNLIHKVLIDDKDENPINKRFIPYIVLSDTDNTYTGSSKKYTRIFPSVQNYKDVTLPDFIYLGFKDFQPNAPGLPYVTVNYATEESGDWNDPIPNNHIKAPGVYRYEKDKTDNIKYNSTNCNLFYIMDYISSTFKNEIVRYRRQDNCLKCNEGDVEPTEGYDIDSIYYYDKTTDNKTIRQYYKFFNHKWQQVDEKNVYTDNRFIRVLSSSIKKLSPSYPTIKSSADTKTTNYTLPSIYWLSNKDKDKDNTNYGKKATLCKYLYISTPGAYPEDIILYNDTDGVNIPGTTDNNYYHMLKITSTDSNNNVKVSYKAYQCHVKQTVSSSEEDTTTTLYTYTWTAVSTVKIEVKDGKPTKLLANTSTVYYELDPNDNITLKSVWKKNSEGWVKADKTTVQTVGSYRYGETTYLPTPSTDNKTTFLEMKNEDGSTSFEYWDENNSKWVEMPNNHEYYKSMKFIQSHSSIVDNEWTSEYVGCIFLDSENMSDSVQQQMAIVDLTDTFDQRFTFASTDKSTRQRQLLDFTQAWYIMDADRDPNKITTDTSLSYIRITDDSPFSKLLLENDHIHLGDTVTVKYDKLKINDKLRITQYEFNVIENKFNSITLGKTTEDIEDKLLTSGSSISELDNDKDYSTGTQVGNAVIASQNESGEINFENLEATIGNFSKLIADVADIGELNADIATIKTLVVDNPIEIWDYEEKPSDPYNGDIITELGSITPEESKAEEKLAFRARKGISYSWDPDLKILDITFNKD